MANDSSAASGYDGRRLKSLTRTTCEGTERFVAGEGPEPSTSGL